MNALQPNAESPADPPADDTVLELDRLVMHFGAVHAVDGVSLRIRSGQVTALVGESGSGKSTVGRCIVRLVEPSSGAVRLRGTDITHLSRSQLRAHRRDVSIVFQDPAGSLDPRMLVGEVVGEPLRLQSRRLSRQERAEKVKDGLRRVGLRPEVANRYPHELSGGQRQRVSLARALMSEPSLLVADEPTSALDVSVQAAVLNLLADLQRDIGFACLFITHDLSAVEYLADEIAVMYLGQLMEVGTREEIFAHPKHPYTQALLSAAPVADPVRQRERTPVLLGDDLPSAMDPPSGCRFHTRCPVAVPRCAEEVPALRTVGGGSTVACHLVAPDGTAPDIRAAGRTAARTDAGSDASTDAGTDAGTDPGTDAGTDPRQMQNR
jgi:peptide/nickel transport system ATP-binding protein